MAAKTTTERTMMASHFKAQCLAILDQVEQMRISVIVTKHGRPIARVGPLDDAQQTTTMGSVHLIAEADEAYYSTGEEWETDSRHK